MYLNSVLEWHSLDDLSQPAEPAQPSPAGFRALAELEHHVEHGVAAQAAPGRPGPVADRGKGRLDRVGGANALPVLGREVEEVHRLLAIPDQLHRGLGILLLVAGQETVEGPVGMVPGLRHPDLLQCRLHLGLDDLRHGGQHVGGLVHPAALVPDLRIDPVERRPEPHGTVPDRQFRSVHAPSLPIQQHVLPAQGGLAHPVLDGQDRLPALIVHADHHQAAELRLLVAETAVHPVRPDMRPPVLAQVTLRPLLPLVQPDPLEALDHRRREPLRLLPRQSGQHAGHLAGADPLPVQPQWHSV